MKARNSEKRVLLLVALLLLPALQGCSGDMMSFFKKIHPYVGKILGAGKEDKGEKKKDEKKKDEEKPKEAKSTAEGTSKPGEPEAVDDGAAAKPDPHAIPSETGALDRASAR